MRHLCYTDRIFWNDTSVGMAQKLNAYVCIYLGWIYDCIIDYSLVRDSKKTWLWLHRQIRDVHRDPAIDNVVEESKLLCMSAISLGYTDITILTA